MGGFGVVIFLIVIFVAYAGIKENIKKKSNGKALKNRKAALHRVLGNIDGFHTSQGVISINGESALGVDEQSKKIFLLQNPDISLIPKIIGYQELLSSEVFEDGDTVISTERASQAGGALIGGLLFGGTGAIIGGLSGEQRSSKKVSKLTLRITVSDMNQPIHEIELLDAEVGKSSKEYLDAAKRANKWHGIMNVAMKMADDEFKQQSTQAQQKPVIDSQNKLSNSVADEILKLAKLKHAGVITEDEFLQQKQKILNQ